jgi:purine-nucleoside phosphorylase
MPVDVPAAPGATPETAVRATARQLTAALDRTACARPVMAIVLGSGWAPVADRVQTAADIDYGDLPAFPRLEVAGHAGVLRLGLLGGQAVWLLRGRQHAYEHGNAAAMKGAIRSLAAVGVRLVVLTNAAGSLDRASPPGSLMLINDHLNLPQLTPLLGEQGSDRFVDMRNAYDPGLAAEARRVAAQQGLQLHEGVYAWTLGPQFETPAEIRMMGLLGAHAVGMSTVPETILARHAGLRVLALSMLTNLAAGLDDEELSHAQTLSAAEQAAPRAAAFVEALVAAVGRGLPAVQQG